MAGRYVSVRGGKGMPPEELAQVVHDVIDWMRSEAGRKMIEDERALNERTIADLREKRKIDPDDLRRPMSI